MYDPHIPRVEPADGTESTDEMTNGSPFQSNRRTPNRQSVNASTHVRRQSNHESLQHIHHVLHNNQSNESTRSRYALGMFYLLCVIFLWVSSAALIQWIFAKQSQESNHQDNVAKPFFLTYFSTCLFMLYLGSEQLLRTWKSCKTSSSDGHSYHHVDSDHPPVDQVDEQLTTHQTAHLAMLLCPIWFCMEYFYNASLSLTTLSANTILSTTSGVFVLAFNYLLFREKLRWYHLCGVALTIGGSVLVYSDGHVAHDDTASNALLGDALAIGAAIFYGLYTVTVKLRVKDDNQVNWQLLLGFLGLFNFALFWPFFFYLHWTGIETIAWPSSTVLGSLILNGLFGTVLADYLWARSILLTSPLVATMGLTLNIPCSLLIEWLWHGTQFGLIYIAGGVLVLGGFVLVNLSTEDKSADHSEYLPDVADMTDLDDELDAVNMSAVESPATDIEELPAASERRSSFRGRQDN